ncbi:MAG: hypothetical protein ABR886_12705 [Dehalococcoidales bacterium]|jgi:hypothetical protein
MLSLIISGIVIIGIIILIVIIRHRKQQQELENLNYEHYGRWQKYSIEQLKEEISQVIRKKNELQRRLEAFGKASPKIVIGKRDFSGQNNIESQMWDIRTQLEELDVEQEDLRQVLNYKIAAQQSRIQR